MFSSSMYNGGIDMEAQGGINATPPPYEADPGPRGNKDEAACFLNCDLCPSLMMCLSPQPCQDWEGQDWFGSIEFKCSDIPALMRNGLHFAEANVQREQGFIVSPPKGVPPQTEPLTYSRIWFLRSTGQGTPSWTARLEIDARTLNTLSSIRMDDLSAANVAMCKAWNRRGEMVYVFEAMDPDRRCNAIYGELPLEGWWPWPKQDDKTPSRY